jgi:hypothetical protein
MKRFVGRAFIRGGVSQTGLPARITENMNLCSPESGPRMFMDRDAAKFEESSSCVIDIHDVEPHLAWPTLMRL